MRIEPLHEEFLAYLEVERGHSPLTIGAYRSDARLSAGALDEMGAEPNLESLTSQVVRQYIAWMRRRGMRPSSIARRICSLRSFWKYLRDTGYVTHDPFFRVATPKKEPRPPVYLSADELARLLEAAERQSSIFLSFRDKAVLATLVFTGMRRGELLNLRVTSVDFEGQKLVVEKGKGNKTRVLPLALPLQEALRDWLDLRPQCDHAFLFTTQWGARMSKYGLTSALRRALKRAGITKPGITLHKLRHSFACLVLQNGCDLYSLSEMLGHTRLDTTAVYLHATVEHLRSALACHPLIHEGKPGSEAGGCHHQASPDGRG